MKYNRPTPPDCPSEAADGRSCDAGNCNQPSIGWRWFTDVRQWLPACESDMSRKGVPPEFKRYDRELGEQDAIRAAVQVLIDHGIDTAEKFDALQAAREV